MNDIQVLVGNLQNEIDSMTDLLYQGNGIEGCKCLNNVIELITHILQREEVRQINLCNGEFSQNLVMSELGKALAAMEQKDYILFADIFHFEIKEQFNVLLYR